MGDLKQSEEEKLEGEEDQSFLAPTGGARVPDQTQASRRVRSPVRLATAVTELAFHSLLLLLPHHRESENRG